MFSTVLHAHNRKPEAKPGEDGTVYALMSFMSAAFHNNLKLNLTWEICLFVGHSNVGVPPWPV